jgi:CO dehydrogenase maturation factor
MKIAVTGKGGTGKTTLAGVLAHFFKNDGYRVLAVDADPDANLASAIGIPPDDAAAIVPISRRSELIRERTGADPGGFGQMFKMNPVVGDIPDKYCIDSGGIKLLVIGAVQKGGKGCACPENVLVQSLLSEIVLNRDEVVIVDMEAGIEHLGRATCRAVDKMLITAARRIMSLAGDIGLKAFTIVANKIRSEAEAAWIAAQFPHDRVAGIIHYSETILKADFEERSLSDMLDDDLRAEFELIYRAIK